MSLTNPNTPVSQQDLQDFYHKILPYMGGGSGQTIQVETLPTASADELGNVYQYIGTTGTYTHGFFYECVSDGESTPTYSWEQTSVQPSTGGGHTIEDSEGTDLTQRDTMQFGTGFNATDDSENEKTVVEADVMQSGDMDDIVTPLPTVAPKKEGIKYSTTEQVIGEWIDGSPIYQKSVYISAFPSVGRRATNYAHNISNLKYVINANLMTLNLNYHIINPWYSASDSVVVIAIQGIDNTNIILFSDSDRSSESGYVTIQYTKTTDTATT